MKCIGVGPTRGTWSNRAHVNVCNVAKVVRKWSQQLRLRSLVAWLRMQQGHRQTDRHPDWQAAHVELMDRVTGGTGGQVGGEAGRHAGQLTDRVVGHPIH